MRPTSTILFLLFSIAFCFCEELDISFPEFSDSSIDDCLNEPSIPLLMDTAQVQFSHKGSDYENVSLFLVSSNCYQCEYEHLFTLGPYANSCYYTFSTDYPLKLELIGEKTQASVNFIFSPEEHSIYLISFQTQQNNTIVSIHYQISVLGEPINTNKPIWVTLGILGALAVFWPTVLFFYRKLNRIYQHSKSRIRVNQEYSNIEEASSNNAPVLPSSNSHFTTPIPTIRRSRLTSLDTFRGLSLTIMIFVNFGGGGYWFFDHSLWNGLTVADIVFPWFIFIMGVAMPLSFAALKRKGNSTLDLFKKSIKRSLILFGLGVFLNNGMIISTWRISGVLQRFGGSYLFVALIMLFVPTTSFLAKKKGGAFEHIYSAESLLSNVNSSSSRRKFPVDDNNGLFADFLPYTIQWIVALMFLTVWLLVTFMLNVPHCGRGYLGPGGIGDFGKYENCTGGASGYIDELILGKNHIFCDPTCKEMYRTGCYDPEGLLGYLTSIFLCFLGVTCGRIFHTFQGKKDRIVRLVLWGLFWGLLGSILCEFKQDGGWIPINKNLWSVSFIFVMAGTGFLVLCLCYILVDVLSVWNGAPFKYPGMNSILVYCGSEILAFYFPFHFQMSEKYIPQHSSMMLQNVVGVSVLTLLSYIMYLDKFFVNI